jgi:hypothetical protein
LSHGVVRRHLCSSHFPWLPTWKFAKWKPRTIVWIHLPSTTAPSGFVDGTSLVKPNALQTIRHKQAWETNSVPTFQIQRKAE